MTRIRTSLPAPTSFDKEAVKRNAFRDQGILVVNVNDPMLPWPEKEMLRQIGERLYGKKKPAKE